MKIITVFPFCIIFPSKGRVELSTGDLTLWGAAYPHLAPAVWHSPPHAGAVSLLASSVQASAALVPRVLLVSSFWGDVHP